MKDELKRCAICGEEHSVAELVEFADVLICQSCLETETAVCERCGERIWSDDDQGDENIHLCERCYDRYYTTCTDCGRILAQDDAYYLDEDDYEGRCYSCHCRRADKRCIHDYYYKPEPIFYGSGSRYFGVELEIDGAGESDRNAGKILDIANHTDELVYIKHDGSLDDGFEIVTEPMTLDYHERKMPWAEVLAKAKELGYLSHQANTCGLHVHVNRSAFGETEAEQDECIARILFFVEKHWEELLKFSRRTQRQLSKWAQRYGYKDQPKEILEHAKKGYRGERYTCVNLTNYSTIEFRMFRGTLKYNTLIATLQLLDRICDVALYFNDDEIRAMSWTTFVSGCTQPELVQYLKERRLYVNEPVECQGEEI